MQNRGPVKHQGLGGARRQSRKPGARRHAYFKCRHPVVERQIKHVFAHLPVQPADNLGFNFLLIWAGNAHPLPLPAGVASVKIGAAITGGGHVVGGQGGEAQFVPHGYLPGIGLKARGHTGGHQGKLPDGRADNLLGSGRQAVEV